MKPVKTGVFFYIPAKFDVQSFPSLSPYANEAHWLLNKIICTAHTYRHELSDDAFVPVSRQTLETFIDWKRVSTVRQASLDHGIIQCDGIFVPAKFDRDGGGKSFGYRIEAAYVGDLRRVECTNRALGVKVRYHRIRFRDQPMHDYELDDLHAYLLGWLRRLRIDVDAAYREIEGVAKAKLKNLSKRVHRKIAKGALTYLDIVLASRAANRMTVDTIHHGDWDFIVCPYGRVHTPATRLLTEARQWLRIDGERLVNLDIRNSQLVFFVLLLLESYYAEMGRDDGNDDGGTPFGWGLACVEPSVGKSSGQSRHQPRSTVLSSSRRSYTHRTGKTPLLESAPDDVNRFIQRVLDGTIYDHLMAQLNQPDRKQFKGHFFRDVLYGNPTEWYARNSTLAHAFGKEFPTVMRFINHQKRDGYQMLARRMQERESRYMIGTVCQRLMDHHRDVPVITIHDSILTTPPHTMTVRRVMEEEFRRLGVSPAIAGPV